MAKAVADLLVERLINWGVDTMRLSEFCRRVGIALV